MPTLDWFRTQIRKIPNSKINGTRAFILCPFHKESTPSGVIGLDSAKSHRFHGRFKCFGCGKTSTWNELAEKFGLETIEGNQAVLKEVPEYDLSRIRAGLMETNVQTNEKKAFDLFNVREKWRGFDPEFLNKVGIKLAYHDDSGKFYLYMPVSILGKEVGFIRAEMRKPKDKRTPTYLNARGEWTLSKGLFPYDYSVGLMKEIHSKTMVLVEGPRDSLRLLKSGVPALSILGTQNWSDKKRRLLERAGVRKIVLLMDGDKPGKDAAEAIYPTLKDRFDVKVIPLWIWAEKQGVDKVDPCSMPLSLIKKIRNHI